MKLDLSVTNLIRPATAGELERIRKARGKSSHAESPRHCSPEWTLRNGGAVTLAKLRAIRIADLNLSTRGLNCLMMAGLSAYPCRETVGDFLDWANEQPPPRGALIHLRHLGRMVEKEILAEFNHLGAPIRVMNLLECGRRHGANLMCSRASH